MAIGQGRKYSKRNVNVNIVNDRIKTSEEKKNIYMYLGVGTACTYYKDFPLYNFS